MSRSVVSLVATFFKDSSHRLRMDSLTAFTEEPGHDGRRRIARCGYDIDWSEAYASYLIHMSNSGGGDTVTVSGIYYTDGPVTIIEEPTSLVDLRDSPPWEGQRTTKLRERNKTRRLKRLPNIFRLKTGENLLDWMDANAIHDQAVFCSGCRDYFPGGQLCSHCWWCDNTMWYSTPSERCHCRDRQECLDGADDDA